MVTPRNLRLGHISETDYHNWFHVTEDAGQVSELAVRYNNVSKPGWIKEESRSADAAKPPFIRESSGLIYRLDLCYGSLYHQTSRPRTRAEGE